MINLYLFTVFGIFAWDQYPSYQECLEVSKQLTVWLQDVGSTKNLYSIECIKLGEIK